MQSINQYDMTFPLTHQESRADVENALGVVNVRLRKTLVAAAKKAKETLVVNAVHDNTDWSREICKNLSKSLDHIINHCDTWETSSLLRELENVLAGHFGIDLVD